jgi:hypothetical protein
MVDPGTLKVCVLSSGYPSTCVGASLTPVLHVLLLLSLRVVVDVPLRREGTHCLQE